MGKVNINVLLIGKSGSGKSSLINYLCGKEVEEVGVGKPITSKGLFEHIVEFDSCFLHVFDTWGLEPDKTEEWKDIIYEELRKRNTGSIKERFHFIVYCINVNSARIEDFEISFLDNLLKEKDYIIVALTHSDNVDANSLCSIRNLLIDIGIQTDNIVNVCSVEKRMIGGKSSKPFGKELLIEKIQKSFWTMICDTISEKIRIKAKSEIEYTTNKLKLYIDKSVNFFNMHSNRKMKVINEFCNEEYRLLGVKIGNFTSETVNEALYYYMALCNMFFLDCCQDDYAYKKDIPHFEFSMDFEDKLAEDIAMIVVSFVPIINLLVPQLMTEIKRDEYKQELLSRQDKLIEICDRMCDEIMHSINELKV